MQLILCLALTLATPVPDPQVTARPIDPGTAVLRAGVVTPVAAGAGYRRAVASGAGYRVPVAADAGYRWPVDEPRVVRVFAPPARPWLAGHRGVDVATRPGAVVHAVGRGTVVHAGRIAGRGVVSILHPGGLRSTYEPVEVDARLRPGEPVAAGSPVGVLAAGHCPAEACLHWGLRRGEQYLDPLSLLGLGRVRLLPL